MSSFDLVELDLDELTPNEPLASTNIGGKGTLPDSSGDAIVAAGGGQRSNSCAPRPMAKPSTPSAPPGSPHLIEHDATRQGSSSIGVGDDVMCEDGDDSA
jgi:hypothetical protein